MNKNHSQYNVFIFNFNDNNKQDIAFLQRTFKNLDCEVRLHDQPDYEEFHEAVEYIRTKMFTIFEYVVIVVLANKNPGSDVLRTRDERIVFINRDLVCRIEFNPTLRYDNKKLLILLQTNDNLLEDEEYKRFKKENQICPLTKQLDQCFSAASLENLKVKQVGITICISAAQFDEQLDDDWSGVDPPVSPFIQAFCDSFGVYAEEKDINEIFEDMSNFLPDRQPIKEVNCGISKNVFGKPISNPRLKNLYINQ